MPKAKKRGTAIGGRSVGSTKRNSSGPVLRPHETEEEAVIRRFHDAQRMARFRAKRKKALEEAQAVEPSGISEITVLSEIRKNNVVLEFSDPAVKVQNPRIIHAMSTQHLDRSQAMDLPSAPGQSKYSQLLGVIEELGKDIRLTYAGSRTSVERLRTGIARAKLLVKDCLMEAEKNSF